MTIVSVEIHLDERSLRLMREFLKQLRDRLPRSMATRDVSRERQRCRRYGYVTSWRGVWSITDAGLAYLAEVEKES